MFELYLFTRYFFREFGSHAGRAVSAPGAAFGLHLQFGLGRRAGAVIRFVN